TLASAINGKKTSSGNHPGHAPPYQPLMPKVAAINPKGTAPTSPMKSLAGGKFITRQGAIAAPSAQKIGASPAPAIDPAIAYAPKPINAIATASPSLPSMKLNRFAIHTIATTAANGLSGASLSQIQAPAAIVWMSRRVPAGPPYRSPQTTTTSISKS